MFPDLTRDDVFRLETRRLWLRWPRHADAVAIARQAGEKALAEMTARIPHPYPPDEAERFVLQARRANADGAGLIMAITPRSRPNTLIGMVSITDAGGGLPHLGFWLGIPAWGQGLATEAARALVDAFFAYTPGSALESCARVTNPASRRVLEKCGFAGIGSGMKPFPARGGVFPVDEFKLDRRKWESLKSWSVSDYVPLARAEHAIPASLMD